ncbi:MAG: lactate utilization protein B [Firmicutes bacterium]|nr:lactate utilization protein B [Bacillota bacterium]
MGELPKSEASWPVRRDRALSDETLRRTLQRVTGNLNRARIKAYETLPQAEIHRRKAVQVKADAIDHLDELLEEAIRQITRHGGIVHQAQTPEEARMLIAQIARDNQVQHITKSKSMTTEEIDLNPYLLAQGFHVRETDLGEFIIQLAHEHPSHILAPAIHKSKEQVRELFAQTHPERADQLPDTADIPQLTKWARIQLQNEFYQADMGITGGNFLVAETGTVVILTNEGNAEMVTDIPRIVVSLLGIEKIVANWNDLSDLVEIPALSGVGQELPTYTTFLSGPRQENMMEGPQQWHVVLLDNGRRALAQTDYADVLSCVRCGACLNICPVFQEVGGHGYGTVYSGPIGVVESPLLGGLAAFAELPVDLCNLCGACTDVCPMDIDLDEHIRSLRQTLFARDLLPPAFSATDCEDASSTPTFGQEWTAQQPHSSPGEEV